MVTTTAGGSTVSQRRASRLAEFLFDERGPRLVAKDREARVASFHVSGDVLKGELAHHRVGAVLGVRPGPVDFRTESVNRIGTELDVAITDAAVAQVLDVHLGQMQIG